MNSVPDYHHDYRYSPSPYKAPSRNANRSRTNLDICDETWPLDEVIEKIDIKSDSEDDYNFNRNIQTWQSGPQLVSETFNSSKDVNRIPGEGALFSSFHEGTKTWKNKAVRHHEYNSKKGTQFDLSTKYTKPTKYTYDDNNNCLNDSFGEETSAYLHDESPTLRDVGIQCNLKRMNPMPKATELHIVTQKPPIKVIKSSTNGFVSTYSDVPKLAANSSSKTTETRHKIFDSDHSDFSLPTDVIYSQVDKSYKNRPPSNTTNNSNISIIYKQPMNESINSYNSINNKYDVKTKEIGFNVNNLDAHKVNLPNPNYIDSPYRARSYRDLNVDIPIEKEIIEETISISNASTEDSYQPNDKLIANKYGDNLSFTGNSITSKSSSNYRRESPLRNVSYERSDFGRYPNYETLEKNRNLKAKSKKKKNNYDNDENVLLANNSLRLKSSKSPCLDRLYKSNADLQDNLSRDETRGGLAAAYKTRQQQNRHRALSLSRMNGTPNEEEHMNHCQVPSRYLSQTHLNNLSSRCSDSGSSYHRSNRQIKHERDPIVMYIPTANNPNLDSPKLTSILRNNSTKSTTTLPSKSKKLKEQKNQSKTNLKEKEKNDKKKTNDINRRHSMPKDTKFNWFSKFKLKSK